MSNARYTIGRVKERHIVIDWLFREKKGILYRERNVKDLDRLDR